MVALSPPGRSLGAIHPWTGALLEALPAAQPHQLPHQEEARRWLAQNPFPSRRQEAWRFTDPAALLAVHPQPLAAAASPLPPAAPGVVRIRLGTGADPLAGVPLPPGLDVLPALPGAEATEESSWCDRLTAATAPAVLALRVRGVVGSPLELVSDTGTAEGVLPLRVLLLLEPGARLELLQVHRAAGASLTTVSLEARLGAGAELRHGLLGQGGSPAAVLLAQLTVRQEPESRYTFTSAVAGWGCSRLEPRLLQAAGAAHSVLRSLQRVGGQELADQHSQVRFEGPEGNLEQLHKTIADGAGRSVFDGAVQVPRAAQGTRAAQLSRSLLLSDRARVDTKPQLEIVADDVRCTHGATVTRLQQEELFYLRSRGIDARRAGQLLLRGFCAEVLEHLPAAAGIWQPLMMVLGEEATLR